MKRSDGKECGPLLRNTDHSKELCPKCFTMRYEITCMGGGHNSVKCSCGWIGCQCELLSELDVAARRGFESVQHREMINDL